MIHLRLFKATDPFREIDCRELAAGSLVIGCDPSADWVIPNERGDLSRRHCILKVEDGCVTVRDTSRNGVDVGADRTPAILGEQVKVKPGESIFLGEYMIVVDEDGGSGSAPQKIAPPTLVAAAADRAPGPAPTDAAMLEAFCRGAGLEPSSFAGEDASEVMRRLGAGYRAVIEDLSALMRDRASMKNQMQLDRTTISSRDNNPLKWASPDRVAVDLLRDDGSGFLKDADAFRASFADLRRHNAGVLAGADAAVRHVLEVLEPDAIEASVKRQPLHFLSRFEAAAKRLRDLHGQLVLDAAGRGAGAVERAFSNAYQDRVRKEDGEAA